MAIKGPFNTLPVKLANDEGRVGFFTYETIDAPIVNVSALSRVDFVGEDLPTITKEDLLNTLKNMPLTLTKQQWKDIRQWAKEELNG